MKYFEESLATHEGMSEEAKKRWEQVVPTIKKRMAVLEAAMQLSGLPGEKFAVGAKALFQQQILDSLPVEEVARLAGILAGNAAPPKRIEWQSAVTLVDMDFIYPQEQEAIWRLLGIGGSDVAAVKRLSPFKGPQQTWADKTGQPKRNLKDVNREYIFQFGHSVEKVVIDDFCRRFGFERVPESRMFRHNFFTCCTANVDGIVKKVSKGGKEPEDEEYYIFEAKTANPHKRDAWLEGVPDYYVTQCRHYMGVLGDKRVKGTYIGCAFNNAPGESVYWFVPRDEEAELRQLDEMDEFWNEFVLTGKEPPLSGNVAVDREQLSRTPIKKRTIILSHTASELCEQWIRLDTERKEKEKEVQRLTEARDKIACQLQAAMGENAKAVVDGYAITQSDTTRAKKVNTEKLRVKYPDAFRDCKSEESPTRRFKVKKVEV
jgi:predicted phage-related endonuclease